MFQIEIDNPFGFNLHNGAIDPHRHRAILVHLYLGPAGLIGLRNLNQFLSLSQNFLHRVILLLHIVIKLQLFTIFTQVNTLTLQGLTFWQKNIQGLLIKYPLQILSPSLLFA